MKSFSHSNIQTIKQEQLKYLTKKKLIKYLIAFAILSLGLFKWAIFQHALVQLILPTLKFVAILFISIQTLVLLYRVRNNISLDDSDNIIRGISNLFTILIFLAFFFTLLKYNGIGIVHFFTSLSIVAAAIAIISKEYLTSLISGFALSFTKIINIGDYVTIGEFKGWVKDIKLSKLHLENDHGEFVILNNDKVFHSDIINHTLSTKRRVNIKFELPTEGFLKIDDLEAALQETLSEFSIDIQQDSYLLRIEEIFIDKIVYTFSYTIQKVKPDIERAIRKKSIREIVNFIQNRIKTKDS